MLHKKKPNVEGDTSPNNVFSAYDNVVRRGSKDSGQGIAYTIKPAIVPNAPVPQPVEVPIMTKPEVRAETSKKPTNNDSFRARQQLVQNSMNKSLSEYDKEILGAASKSSDDVSQPTRGNYVNLDWTTPQKHHVTRL